MGWLQKENREHSIRSYLGHLKVGFMERLRCRGVQQPVDDARMARGASQGGVLVALKGLTCPEKNYC